MIGSPDGSVDSRSVNRANRAGTPPELPKRPGGRVQTTSSAIQPVAVHRHPLLIEVTGAGRNWGVPKPGDIRGSNRVLPRSAPQSFADQNRDRLSVAERSRLFGDAPARFIWYFRRDTVLRFALFGQREIAITRLVSLSVAPAAGQPSPDRLSIDRSPALKQPFPGRPVSANRLAVASHHKR
jgi:hypothetical protein